MSEKQPAVEQLTFWERYVLRKKPKPPVAPKPAMGAMPKPKPPAKASMKPPKAVLPKQKKTAAKMLSDKPSKKKTKIERMMEGEEL